MKLEAEYERERRLFTTCAGDINEASQMISQISNEMQDAVDEGQIFTKHELEAGIISLNHASKLLVAALDRHESTVLSFSNSLKHQTKRANLFQGWLLLITVGAFVIWAAFHS